MDHATLNGELETVDLGGFGFESSPGSSGYSAEMSNGTLEHCSILDDLRNYVGSDELDELLPYDEDKIPLSKISVPMPEPEPRADEMCEVLHPETKTPYMVSKKVFCHLLEQSGTRVQTYSKDSHKILTLVEQFCDHAHIEFMTHDHARMIKNSGYSIDVLSTKKGKSGRYKCVFCPLIGSMCKSFPNKENLIRHNALHLRYNKFRCGYCEYKHFRKDTIDQHINLKHPTQTGEKKIYKLTR